MTTSKREKSDEKGITVGKHENMPEWYGQVVIKSELADYSPVRGTMIIRPYGYAIWQNIMDYFNSRLKLMDIENAYFPLFIPENFFKKEAEHAEGFKPEVAWIQTKDEDSKERLALRPTSETIMYDSYAKWIRSHRDLPLRINQWCNIIRWEVKDVKLYRVPNRACFRDKQGNIFPGTQVGLPIFRWLNEEETKLKPEGTALLVSRDGLIFTAKHVLKK